MRCETAEPAQLKECLVNHLKKAGNLRLLPPTLIDTLAEHSAGNCRVLMNMANDLLSVALQRELEQIDEKLFLEVFALNPKPSRTAGKP